MSVSNTIHKRIPSILYTYFISLTFAVVNGFSQAPPMTPTSELPTTKDLTSQQARGARAAYFDNFASADGVTLEARDPRGPATMIYHTPPPKSELPQELADVIVVGKITAVQAYLSHNRGAIYTESTVLVEEVISTQQSLATGGSLVILQDGGAIQVASGAVLTQAILGSGNELRKNGEYLFFLRGLKSLQAYGCTKAWALVNGTVTAVAPDDLARAAKHTSAYQGMPVPNFLFIARTLKASLQQQ